MAPDTGIRCMRCDSTVPWGPFCPRCGAYLEFAGDPPWKPDLSGTETALEASPVVAEAVTEEIVVTTALVEVSPPAVEGAFAHLYTHDQPVATSRGASGMGWVAVVGVLVIGVIGGLGLTLLTNAWIGGVFAVMCLAWGIVLIPRRSPDGPGAPASPASRGGRAAVLGVLLIGVLGSVGLSYLTSVWIGVMFGLVCLAWAIVLWPKPGDTPQPIAAASPVFIEEVTEVEFIETVAEVTVEEPPATVEARAPQHVPTRAVEVPVTARTRTPAGDVPCPACGQLNLAGRHYCQGCGAVMPDAIVAPATIPHLEVAADDDGSDARGRSPRLSRSWRGPIIAGTLAFVFLSAVVLSVFGPFAFQFRLGTTQVFQAINTFIDPFAGNRPNVRIATATSTLPGTSPDQLVGDDASTFWASAPSFNFGAGNSVTLRFDKEYTINRMVILPGIQNGLFDVRALATPWILTVTFDDGTSVTRELELIESQSEFRQLFDIPRTTTTSVTVTFDSVYSPRRGKANIIGSLAVSGIYFIEPPAPPAIVTVPTEIRQKPALPGTTN